MSLIPYHPREGREIVLRHRNAIVVRDPSSHRLEIRGLKECPTCHQPLTRATPTAENESYVNPDYFRMLRARHDHHLDNDNPPSSPIRRLVEPLPPHSSAPPAELEDAEFMSSTPATNEGGRIRSESFSPHYFSTFFVEEAELGRGGKGVVLLVRHEIDGCNLGHFACKRVPVGDDHAWLEKVLIEVELLAKLSHPNLVSYRHVWLEDMQLSRFGPSVACAFILQQYCNGGDLLRYIIGDQPQEATKEELKSRMRRRSRGQAEERPRDLFPRPRQLHFDEIYSLFKDITSGLAYLHEAGYIHRDLKPSNCLLHSEGASKAPTCLISDFGEVQPEKVVRRSTGSTGTISYCAPEVLRKDATGNYGNFTTKSDVFSLGMILYFMCFGHLPYRGANTMHEELEDIDLLRAEIADWKGFQDERRERPDLPSKLYQLLKRLLALDPLERPSAAEVLSAIKNESSLDGLTRGGTRSSSPPIGVAGRRVQNLDSPLPPSTPTPEVESPEPSSSRPPVAPADVQPASGDGASQRHHHHNHQSTSAPRHRTHAMALSRSQDAVRWRPPDRALAPDSGNRGQPPSPAGSPTTPLLMPPPSTFLSGVKHRALIAQHHTVQYARENTATVLFGARLAIFLVKMASLARPCWPYSVNLGIGCCLVALAGTDLGLPVAHLRPPLAQMEARSNHGSAVHDDSSSRPAPPSRRDLAVRGWARWDWRISTVLLVLHFLLLFATLRLDALCPTSLERWTDWRMTPGMRI